MKKIASLAENVRGIVGAVRELILLGGIAILIVVIVVWPEQIKLTLSNAGIASLNLGAISLEAQKTKDVGQTVSELDQRLTELTEQIDQETRPGGGITSETLMNELKALKNATGNADALVKKTVLDQQEFIERATGARVDSVGWIYLGKINEAKTRWVKGHPKTIVVSDPTAIANDQPVSAGDEFTIKDAVYLRADPKEGEKYSQARIIGALPVGQKVSVLELADPPPHATRGGWFVWAKVVRRN